MSTEAMCPRCEELWCAFAYATRDHLLALKEQERAHRRNPAKLHAVQMRVEALGAEQAAARVKITTHLALAHSKRARERLLSAAAC
jgi:transposase-like protein